ncbi:MAG: amidohydrolase [Aureibaculum sp.]|nr:amidohydrolase [Aureibaculum sp.]
MQDLKIVLIQIDLVWENPKQNKNNIDKKIDTISEKIDLIILPEMFTTGFTMNPYAFAETMDGEIVLWLKSVAKTKNTAITGSLIIKENGKYYNRLVFVFPSGEIHIYDKRHTFTFAGEDKVFTAGDNKLIVDYRGWKICPLICYDLRFPVWARNVENYDVLLYVANWPKPRINAWNTLLKARAIENMCYCVGVNRVGVDLRGNTYTGNSSVYDSLGKKLSTTKPHIEATEILVLNKDLLIKNRREFQFLNDRDDFKL